MEQELDRIGIKEANRYITWTRLQIVVNFVKYFTGWKKMRITATTYAKQARQFSRRMVRISPKKHRTIIVGMSQ